MESPMNGQWELKSHKEFYLCERGEGNAKRYALQEIQLQKQQLRQDDKQRRPSIDVCIDVLNSNESVLRMSSVIAMYLSMMMNLIDV